MKAIVATGGAVDGLRDVELPPPVAGAHDLVVEVRAVSVNPVDAKVRARAGGPGPPRVLGWDAAGVVAEVGPAVTRFRPGDEVWFAGDVRRAGSNAERCAVDERIVGRKPRSLGFAEAAALPLTALTAHEALLARVQLGRGAASAGKRLLVIGGAGGVGSVAIQLAKALTGASVTATASRPESAAWARELGADHVIDHARPLGPQLEGLGLPAPDVVLCTADTDPYFSQLAALIAPQGTLCFIVPPRAPVDLAPLHARSAAVAWELMFTRSTYGTADLEEQHRILTEVAALVDAGRIRSTLRQRLGPICAATLREAHRRIERGDTIGKIVLEGWG
ncbi:MAG: zinc-binding alcohol dehydrogenase family protein [Anaeromyxobacter sp.]